MKKILISHNGLLGDTLNAIPALTLIKKNYENSKIFYLYEENNKNNITGKNILINTNLVDEYLSYRSTKNIIIKIYEYINLAIKLKRINIDTVVILQEPHWPRKKVTFFKLCGIKNVYGPEGDAFRHPCNDTGELRTVPKMADSLIQQLKPIVKKIPDPNNADFFFPVSIEGKKKIEKLKSDYKVANKGFYVISPWSNMPAKRWPIDRYKNVIKSIREKYPKLLPIFVGGKEEERVCENLIKELKIGINFSGKLSIEESIELISHGLFFLGNDSGPMHMAAAKNIPCVAIFTARDNPGRWYPYGENHTVFRKWVPCEGCMLRECTENNMKCIKSIKEEEVYRACSSLIQKETVK